MIDLDATVLAAAQDAFAEWAFWTPAGGTAQRVPLIFWDNSKETKFQDGEQVEQMLPVASVRLSQFPGMPARGDVFLIRGVSYTARNVYPDGMGAARIPLSWSDDSQAAVVPAAPDPVLSQ